MPLTQRMFQLLSLVAVLLALWPTTAAGTERFPDKLELVGLLRAGQFEELEARLTTYQESFEAGGIAEDVVDAAFFAFANSDLALEPRFSQWLLRFPESYAAPLARGVYYWQLGWLSRGGGYVRKTLKLRFAEMRNYFSLAVPELPRGRAHRWLCAFGRYSRHRRRRRPGPPHRKRLRRMGPSQPSFPERHSTRRAAALHRRHRGDAFRPEAPI